MQTHRVFRKLRASSAGAFYRPAAMLRFVTAALIGPFILLTVGGTQSNNLPWYFWTTILLILLLVMSVGFPEIYTPIPRIR
jgi:hypothetical protein